MAKNMALNGMIHSKYQHESDMAKAMNWPKQRLNKITNGNKVPDLSDLEKMAKALDSSVMALVPLFLPEQSTNVDN